MAEVKNSFIKSKMNKDLDARLLPNGEYREGINIQVSRSEGADVGALENVLGNELILDLATETGVSGLECIGMYSDDTNDNIYLFLTDYTATKISTITGDNQRQFNAASLNYYEGANNFIYVYNTASRIATMLVRGAFLNFSTTNPIYSVNLLEDILFWTDNRNQPRRINVQFANSDSAITNPTYYTTEDQISVATYNPYQAIDLYYLNDSPYNTNGGQGSIGTDSATVALNVPTSTLVGINPASLVGAIVTGNNIASNTKIVSYIGDTLTVDITPTATVVAGTVLTFNANTNSSTYVTSMLDVTSPNLPDGTTINPDYNPNYSGDPDYLEDKFVRFSYRFKYEDGEVSIMAPFTQAAFIPKQDGYFLGATSPTGNTDDENSTYRSTVVEFMENKVNQILLQIPLPSQGKSLKDDFKVSEIEILYKESDSLAVKVVDTISWDGSQGFGKMPDPANPGSFIDRTTESVEYSYQGVKPYKTLPEADLTRVYDKVPVRALTQEVISNRIVYGNFQNKHTPPEALDFNVGIFDKYSFNIGSPGVDRFKSEYYTSITEYPMHTVKQNRNYQVGIVLSDKYGRSSTTILSSEKNQGTFLSPITGDVSTFQGGTIYHPYSTAPAVNNTVNSWPGDSIKILFNNTIEQARSNPDLQSFWPGLYNGDSTSENYNPLGWYSYKIVVKQQEQEYYNVYLPGILNGYPGAPATPPDPANTTAFLTLINDNINKVPRDLTEVGPEQKQFRSSVQLYGRVTPDAAAPPTYNTQFYPGTISDTVNTIAEENDILGTTGTTYSTVYQTESNPLLARVTQGNTANPIGGGTVAAAATYNVLLGVYETMPTESVIDIYWETSTSGTIEDLNNAVNTTDDKSIIGFKTNQSIDKWVYNHYEDINTQSGGSANSFPFPSVNSTYTPGAVQPYTVVPFFPYYAGGDHVTESTMVLSSVIDGAGRDRTSEFQLNRLSQSAAGTPEDVYAITVTSNFYYGTNADIDETYTFTLIVTDTSIDANNKQTTLTAFGSLQNIGPSITNCLPTFNNEVGAELITTYNAVNGSADSSRNKNDLTFAIVSQSPNLPELTIDQQGNLNDPSKRLNGEMTLEVSVTDSAGATDTCTTVFNGSVGYRTIPLNDDFYTCGEKSVNGGPLIINKASESSGFYWSTAKDVNINGDAVPGADAIPSPKPVNREPVTGLTLPTTLEWVEGSDGTETISVSDNSNCAGWSWTNTNRTATSSVTYDNTDTNVRISVLGDKAYNGKLTFGEPIGITTGTAYIIVDFEVSLLDGVALADAPGLIWPTYLQFREAGTSTWQNVTDIEGQLVKFGQTQVNDWTISNDGSGAFNKSGVIDDRVKSRSTVANGDYDPFNAAEAYNYGRPTSLVDTAASLTATCRQVVAVGMCQAYRNQSSFTEVSDAPDKLGDYRLTVRYPGGRNQEYTTSASAYADNGNNPALAVGYCPPTPYNDYEIAQQTQQVKLQFGDFYNPFQFSVKQNAISFAYRVSKQGNKDPLTAENLNPVIEVYAREWSLKYVSRFFLDARLTQPWEPGTAGSDYSNGQTQDWYYCFSSNSNGDANAIYGTDNANVEREDFTAYNDEIQWSNRNRKWIGQFTPLGIKVKGTCIPLEYQKESPGSSPGPPNTEGAVSDCGSAQQIMPNFYDATTGIAIGQSLLIKAGNIKFIPSGDGGISLQFIFEGENTDSIERAKTDSQAFCTQFVASGTPDFTAPNPVSSAPVYFWRKKNSTLDLWLDYMQVTFGKGSNINGTPTNALSELTYSPTPGTAAFNSSSQFIVTITNCFITNTGSDGGEIKSQAADYWICNPNA
tara:strand:- start:1675 stop:7092 length:5418 start_codon:yes stop_codon:yes gene_type:complete